MLGPTSHRGAPVVPRFLWTTGQGHRLRCAEEEPRRRDTVTRQGDISNEFQNDDSSSRLTPEPALCAWEARPVRGHEGETQTDAPSARASVGRAAVTHATGWGL